MDRNPRVLGGQPGGRLGGGLTLTVRGGWEGLRTQRGTWSCGGPLKVQGAGQVPALALYSWCTLKVLGTQG